MVFEGIWVTGLPVKEEDSYQPWKLKPTRVGVGRVKGSWVTLKEVGAPTAWVPLFKV